MAEIKIGLAPGKSGFYDPLTNTYLTLEKPVKTLELSPFDPKKDLANIVASLLASTPGLVLYEGVIPEDAVKEWKKKYEGMLKAKPVTQKGLLPEDGLQVKQGKYAFDRANSLNSDAVMPMAVEEKQANLFAQAEVQETVEEKVEATEETPVETPKTSRRKAANK